MARRLDRDVLPENASVFATLETEIGIGHAAVAHRLIRTWIPFGNDSLHESHADRDVHIALRIEVEHRSLHSYRTLQAFLEPPVQVFDEAGEIVGNGRSPGSPRHSASLRS